MTMTATNVDILRHGWLDAASALAPSVETLPELLEAWLNAAVRDERLDEQSLLDVVAEVGSATQGSLPPDEMRFLTRRLQRSVYEYLLSLDALPQPPPSREASGAAAGGPFVLGAERLAAPAAVEPPVAEAAAAAPTEEAAEAEPPEEAPSNGTAGQDAQDALILAVVEPLGRPDDGEVPEPGPAETRARPRFTVFRRSGVSSSWPTANGDRDHVEAPRAEPAPEASEQEPDEPERGAGGELFVAPRDGFHLSDLDDFAQVPREVSPAPHEQGPGTTVAPPPAARRPEAARPGDAAAPAAAAGDTAARAWRSREDDAVEEDEGEPDTRFENDSEVVEARLEINDRLRRRRCDEAAALLQRLSSEVGGRALAELALDAGDRCRVLGKGNAALSCYLAGSRADPVHETPLLRLADICMDDHDIDLAVSYLERVTKLRRLRGDDKGALRLYRKIVTIAPYRDDILTMLMRAQSTGRFDD